MVRDEGQGRRAHDGFAVAAVAALLLLGACGRSDTSQSAARPAPAATPGGVPTVERAAANPTATASRPPAGTVTRGPLISGPASHGGPVVDHVSFVDALRRQGCAVGPVGAVRQPFLRGRGVVLRASGCGLARTAELRSFWYHTDDLGADGLRAAEEDARGVGPDGQPTATAVAWAAPPHFFRKERALVLYLGDDPAMLHLLMTLLRPQCAGPVA